MSEVTVDFKGVQDRGNYESGDYNFEITEVSTASGPSGVYLKFKLQFTSGKYAGLFTEEMCSLAQKALWRAKRFFEAVGYDVPDGPMRINTDHFIGQKFRARCEREIDESGKYPPKLRLTEFLDKEPAASGPESPAPESATQPEGGGEGGGEVAKPSEPSEPAGTVSRPKVKV